MVSLLGGRMKAVEQALAAVDRWATAQRTQVRDELVEVENQLGQISQALNNLIKQRDALKASQGQLAARAETLDDERLARAHQAVFETVGHHAKLVGERQQQIAPLVEARLATLDDELRGSAMAPLLEEYDQFVNTVEPNLGSLPESYRSAVVQHHDRITLRLAEHLRSVACVPRSVQHSRCDVELVYAVDAPEGTDELLVVLVPVSDQVVLQWHQQEDGLQTWLAARAVQAIYEAAQQVSFVTVQAACGAHQGLMAVEVELEAAPASFVAAFESRLTALLSTSEELLAAQLVVQPHRVDIDVILPPEGVEIISENTELWGLHA